MAQLLIKAKLKEERHNMINGPYRDPYSHQAVTVDLLDSSDDGEEIALNITKTDAQSVHIPQEQPNKVEQYNPFVLKKRERKLQGKEGEIQDLMEDMSQDLNNDDSDDPQDYRSEL